VPGSESDESMRDGADHRPWRMFSDLVGAHGGSRGIVVEVGSAPLSLRAGGEQQCNTWSPSLCGRR